MCESTFSTAKFMKSKYRASIFDENLVFILSYVVFYTHTHTSDFEDLIAMKAQNNLMSNFYLTLCQNGNIFEYIGSKLNNIKFSCTCFWGLEGGLLTMTQTASDCKSPAVVDCYSIGSPSLGLGCLS